MHSGRFQLVLDVAFFTSNGRSAFCYVLFYEGILVSPQKNKIKKYEGILVDAGTGTKKNFLQWTWRILHVLNLKKEIGYSSLDTLEVVKTIKGKRLWSIEDLSWCQFFWKGELLSCPQKLQFVFLVPSDFFFFMLQDCNYALKIHSTVTST